ncbi:MAG: hypothetical protein AAGI01_06050 [Myxococcota bacterium]
MDEAFGELRRYVQATKVLDAPSLLGLMNRAHGNQPERYVAEWKPYLASFPLPEFTARTLEELALLAQLLPVGAPRMFWPRGCIGSMGAHGLAHSRLLQTVSSLVLREHYVSSSGLHVLLASPYFAWIHQLNLATNDLHAHDAWRLASSGHAEKLRVLDLSGNSILDRGVFALCEGTAGMNLKELYLRHNAITDRGAMALCATSTLPLLTYLDLRGNSLTPRATSFFKDSSHLPAGLTVRLDDCIVER